MDAVYRFYLCDQSWIGYEQSYVTKLYKKSNSEEATAWNLWIKAASMTFTVSKYGGSRGSSATIHRDAAGQYGPGFAPTNKG